MSSVGIPTSEKSFANTDPLVARYVAELFEPEDQVLKKAREYSEENRLPEAQVIAFDARLLELIARAARPKKIVEIGTLGGYSGICLARALEQGGKLYTLEVNSRHAETAQKNFENAGVLDKVEIIQGEALTSLANLSSQGPFDLVFIDADKANYKKYAEWAATHLRMGGVILGDNTFAYGHIYKDEFDEPRREKVTRGIQAFNEYVAKSGIFRSSILPTGEGMTFGVKVREPT